MALFKTLLTLTHDLLPSLIVEVCLVLAPDVNFSLNSRKQGLPCRRSLFFFTGVFKVKRACVSNVNPTSKISKLFCESPSQIIRYDSTFLCKGIKQEHAFCP